MARGPSYRASWCTRMWICKFQWQLERTGVDITRLYDAPVGVRDYLSPSYVAAISGSESDRTGTIYDNEGLSRWPLMKVEDKWQVMIDVKGWLGIGGHRTQLEIIPDFPLLNQSPVRSFFFYNELARGILLYSSHLHFRTQSLKSKPDQAFISKY